MDECVVLSVLAELVQLVCIRYGEGEWLHYNYVTIFSSNDIITRVAMAIANLG